MPQKRKKLNVDFTAPQNPLAVRVTRQMAKDKCKTLTEFVKFTGLTTAFVVDVFNNPANVNPKHKISSERLARYLNVPVDQIYSWAGSNQHVDVNDDKAAYCAYVRNKLHLNRQEASLTFGLGKSAFGSIELGQREPSLTLLMLLSILDKHPKLLDELKLFAQQLD
ncbi:DNA-binding transcriptional regulator YiaG [Oxalobacteraceae bacterium GrIS 1.18]